MFAIFFTRTTMITDLLYGALELEDYFYISGYNLHELDAAFELSASQFATLLS